MRAENMWRTSTGKGVTVAVIDTGVDPSNADLRGQVLPGKDFAQDQPGDERTDYDGHGTGMAGLIAGTGASHDGKGAFGLAPGAKILPIRMPKAGTAANQAEGDKRFHVIAPQAIRYAADHNAKVINLSLGRSEGSPQLTAAVKYALDKGSLVFAAAGNSGNNGNEVEYPAATPGVVGVAAVGKDLRRTAESEYGPQVDLAAPGDDMVHACTSDTGLCTSHGTSDATALASASAALIWAKHPTWTNNQVLRVMLNTVGGPTDGAKRNDSIGYGIVRPRVALENPGDPGPANVYPLPDLTESAPPSSPSPAGRAAGAPAGDVTPPAAEAGGSKASTYVLPLGIGVGALALIGGLLRLWLVRTQRRKAAATRSQLHSPGAGLGWPGQGGDGRTGGF